MIELIQEILNELNQVSAWKINERIVSSEELFFVKKKLDMNRSKEVRDYSVTLYVDFEEGSEKYRGSSKAAISPSMTSEEMKGILKDATFAASFAKNKFYNIAKPSNERPEVIKSNLSGEAIANWMPLFIQAIYEEDQEEGCCINSSEIFLNKVRRRILNSEGVDVTYEQYIGEIELITECNEGKEAVELFCIINFSDYDPADLKERVKDMLKESRERAFAQKTPALKDISVILSGEAVKDFLSFYVNKSSAQAIYEGISMAKIGESLQGREVIGDLISIQLCPSMVNSTESKPYDEDGQLVKPINLMEQGILRAYHGPIQYTDYLKVETTGSIHNIEVGNGQNALESFKKEPYIELISFSDFQMDALTGDFGGEIRLARFFDGQKMTPVTGGSISANINDIHHHLFLSKERIQLNNYIGPKAIKLPLLDIAGS